MSGRVDGGERTFAGDTPKKNPISKSECSGSYLLLMLTYLQAKFVVEEVKIGWINVVLAGVLPIGCDVVTVSEKMNADWWMFFEDCDAGVAFDTVVSFVHLWHVDSDSSFED